MFEMTKTMIKRIGSGFDKQFEIMEALEAGIRSLKSEQSLTQEQRKRLADMERMLKYLAVTTKQTSEDILENVA